MSIISKPTISFAAHTWRIAWVTSSRRGEDSTEPTTHGFIVDVSNPARTDFHHDEDVEELEPRRDNGQEVGDDDRLRMIANECGPALR